MIRLFRLAQADHLTEEQKMFREAYQKDAGQPSRLRTEHARETAFGGMGRLHVHLNERDERRLAHDSPQVHQHAALASMPSSVKSKSRPLHIAT